ncbi:hypothetical protein [Paracoccus sp. SSK6]|uniref:hypothetical protein n=1 Tax=Paracoccus sp. SSK6 TaxID=3143131 RepID=UPI00321B7337
MTAALVAVQGAGVPPGAARGRDAVIVQGAGDVARGRAVRIGFEDPLDDLRLGRIDLGLARSAGHGPVAIRLAAGDAAVRHDTSHAAPDLVLQVRQEQGRDQAPDAHLDGVGAPVMHGHDVDAREGQPLVDAGEILLVAAQAV